MALLSRVFPNRVIILNFLFISLLQPFPVVESSENPVDAINTCRLLENGCNPDNEFPESLDEVPVTEEWVEFMDLITEKTFNYNKTFPCDNEPSGEIIVNKDSQILWDVRFKIYDERQNENEKTINDCYCDSANKEQCDNTFTDCVKSARVSMKNDVAAIWDSEISKRVELLCKNI